MVNFGPLAAEIVSLFCGTPANFNGFHVLAALLHGTLVVGVSQTAARNRGRHLYSAGRPSRWALAHILVVYVFRLQCFDTVGWAMGIRKSIRPVKNEWWDALVLSVWSLVQMICIWFSWCHCHAIISCFIKIQIGLTFLVPACRGFSGKETVKWVLLLLLYCLWFRWCNQSFVYMCLSGQ